MVRCASRSAAISVRPRVRHQISPSTSFRPPFLASLPSLLRTFVTCCDYFPIPGTGIQPRDSQEAEDGTGKTKLQIVPGSGSASIAGVQDPGESPSQALYLYPWASFIKLSEYAVSLDFHTQCCVLESNQKLSSRPWSAPTRSTFYVEIALQGPNSK